MEIKDLGEFGLINRLTKDIVFSQDDWQKEAVCLDKQQKTGQKVYYFDAMEYGRWFPGHLLWRLEPGDPNQYMTLPSVVKCRNLEGDSRLSVLLNMDKVRHFIFVNFIIRINRSIHIAVIN